MTSTRLTEEQLDDEVDRAARAMTELDADPSFRARVIDRLHAAHSRPLFSRRVAVAGALAVLIVGVGLGLIFLRGSRPPQPAGQVATIAPATNAARSVRPVETGPAAGSPSGSVPSGTTLMATSQHTAQGNAGPAGVAAEARGPAPLAHPAPIELGSIAPKAIDISDIDVAPLPEISPLTVPPTTLGSGEPPRRELR